MQQNKATGAPIQFLRTFEKAIFLLEPTRQRLLLELREPASAAELAKRLGLSRQQANYHLRALEKEGCVELVEERRKGNCTERLLRATPRAYVISPEALGALGPDPGPAADRASTGYLVAAAARSIREVAALEQSAQEEGRRLATLTLDAEIRFATGADRSAFAAELVEAFTRLVGKYHAAQHPAERAFRLTATVHPIPPRPAAPSGS